MREMCAVREGNFVLPRSKGVLFTSEPQARGVRKGFRHHLLLTFANYQQTEPPTVSTTNKTVRANYALSDPKAKGKDSSYFCDNTGYFSMSMWLCYFDDSCCATSFRQFYIGTRKSNVTTVQMQSS